MGYSGIGGQAVMEGVMMKNGIHYAVAVRKPDKEIVVDAREYTGIVKNQKIKKIPILRGVINFIDSLVLGMRTLMYSASFFDEEVKELSEEEQKAKEKKESVAMGFTVFLSVILALVIFMLLPYGLSLFFKKWIASPTLLALIEGVIRVVIFFIYIVAITCMEDIKRVYMYHGAEHKCINCVEHGLDLNVENVKNSSRFHKRCGTSFLFLVVFISILFFACIRTDSAIWRFSLRILLVPVIAGVAYEFLRLAGRSENAFVNLLSKPGLWFQKFTTKEPDEDMIELAKKYHKPLLSSHRITSDLMAEVIRWLGVELAPCISIHGVLMDVYGEGILIMGESGIGKSEAALELIKRGHRLITDDVVEIHKVSDDTLVGTSPEITRHFIELRGIGIIDVKTLYGVESVRETQSIDLVIKLEE